ncbi:MAG: hypothetical protein M1524_00735 [Patescibacteria group bacterium]|nr:hypothetical protein [Patescibacteria group bacterium]
MHKKFYASGFFYHPPTQQILLQQKKSTENSSSLWSMFGDECSSEKNAAQTFLRLINKLLKIKIKPDFIHPIYTYFHKDIGKNHAVFYAEVHEVKNFSSKKGVFTWFTFKQILKLQLSEQTKQDLIVGQRVIDAGIRKGLGLKTLE